MFSRRTRKDFTTRTEFESHSPQYVRNNPIKTCISKRQRRPYRDSNTLTHSLPPPKDKNFTPSPSNGGGCYQTQLNGFYRPEVVHPGYTEGSFDRRRKRRRTGGSIMRSCTTPKLADNVVVCRRGLLLLLPVVLTTTPEKLFWRTLIVERDCGILDYKGWWK